jgi:hypothetical protein
LDGSPPVFDLFFLFCLDLVSVALLAGNQGRKRDSRGGAKARRGGRSTTKTQRHQGEEEEEAENEKPWVVEAGEMEKRSTKDAKGTKEGEKGEEADRQDIAKTLEGAQTLAATPPGNAVKHFESSIPVFPRDFATSQAGSGTPKSACHS